MDCFLSRRAFLRLAGLVMISTSTVLAAACSSPPAAPTAALAPTTVPAKPTVQPTPPPQAAASSTAASAPAPAATGAPTTSAVGGLDPQLKAIQAAAKPYNGATLNVISFNFPYNDAIKAQLDDFKSLTGITVKLDVFSEADMVKKVAVELAAGTGAYDVAYADGGLIPQYAQAKWIEPLEPYLNNPKLTDKDALDVADFLQAPWESGQWNKQQYGLPTFVGTQLFYYRKDILQKNGLNPPDTFDDLMAAAKKINSKDLSAFAIRDNRDQAGASWPFPIFYLGYGAQWFKSFPTDMHPTLDSPEGIKACAYWADLLSHYGIPNEATATFDDVILAFTQGKAAMAIEGAPLAAQFLNPAKSKFADQTGLKLVPKGPAGRFPPFSGHNWSLPVSSKQKEAGWLFMQWAVSRSVFLKGSAKAGNVAVTRQSVWKDPSFVKAFTYGGQNLLDAFNQSIAQANAQYRPTIPEWPQLGDNLAVALNEAVTGQKTPDQAMHDLEKDMTALFQKAGYYKS
ncbi:MAG TPA: sugar ABC transporter substrate-binding protein [Chloroflexota bacterium]|nr:sugar ABC transporter substrate-binding protein [Chloroflexota bacterium]